jgi:hypothetical protein
LDYAAEKFQEAFIEAAGGPSKASVDKFLAEEIEEFAGAYFSEDKILEAADVTFLELSKRYHGGPDKRAEIEFDLLSGEFSGNPRTAGETLNMCIALYGVEAVQAGLDMKAEENLSKLIDMIVVGGKIRKTGPNFKPADGEKLARLAKRPY